MSVGSQIDRIQTSVRQRRLCDLLDGWLDGLSVRGEQTGSRLQRVGFLDDFGRTWAPRWCYWVRALLQYLPRERYCSVERYCSMERILERLGSNLRLKNVISPLYLIPILVPILCWWLNQYGFIGMQRILFHVIRCVVYMVLALNFIDQSVFERWCGQYNPVIFTSYLNFLVFRLSSHISLSRVEAGVWTASRAERNVVMFPTSM